MKMLIEKNKKQRAETIKSKLVSLIKFEKLAEDIAIPPFSIFAKRSILDNLILSKLATGNL